MFIPLRDENPTRRVPVVTVLLIAANVVVFLWTSFGPAGLEASVLRFGAVPYELTHPGQTAGYGVERAAPWLALFLSMFLHGGFLHLAGNMLYLWIFGNNIEDVLGPLRFLLFYFLGGIAAGLTHTLLQPASKVPMIGASGAIAAVLGGYALLFPKARVHTLIFLIVYIRVIPVPAVLVLGLWFLLQLLNAGGGGDVAWFAHIGGFLAGLLLALLMTRKRPVLPVDTAPGI
jgi:membrane associated rhomboid family serine protease